MLHILWLLVKYILVFVSILLLLAVLLLAVCLFVPVRYRAQMQKTSQGLQIKGNISWLFHLLSLRVYYEKKVTGFQIRILGIPLKKRRKKTPGATANKEIPKKKVKKNDKKNTMPDTESVLPENKRKQEEANAATRSSDEGFFRKIGRAIRAIGRICIQGILFIWHLPAKLWAIPKKIILTIWKFCGKIKYWKQFLQEERVRQAFSLLWQECKHLLKHLLPRRIDGYILFGMENPAVTGEILAVIGAAYPVHKNKIRFLPVFNRQILEGEVWCRGRCYGIVLLLILCKLYFNKNIQYFYRTINHKEV